MVKSHEFISKTVLKNFSFSDGGKKRAVKYIELPKTRVRHGDIRTLNVRLGAYTDENERILSSEFETYLGDLNAKIEKALKTGRDLDAADFDLTKIRRYFMYQCWRDNSFVDSFLCGMKKTELFNDFNDLNVLQAKNRFITEAFDCDFADGVFDEYDLLVAIDASAGLIGSSYVVSLASNSGHVMLSLALSPRVLFILVPQDILKVANLALKYIKNNKKDGGAWKFLEPSGVSEINATTIRLGMNLGSGYVISDSQEKLQEVMRRVKGLK